jgi:hypothetical protein
MIHIAEYQRYTFDLRIYRIYRIYGDMIHIAEYQRAQTFHGAVNSAIRIMSP